MKDRALTLVVAKDGKVIFEAGSRGISGFLGAVEKLADELEGASVADRVMGKAIALLCVGSKIRAAYALTLSRSAKQLFDDYAVHVEWGGLVANILDVGRTKTCPFERLAERIFDPKEAYEKFKTLQRSLERENRGDSMAKEDKRFISEESELKRIREKKLAALRERRATMTGGPVHLVDSSFDETVKKHAVSLVDFWASWCGPCLALAPTIEELAREYGGKVLVGKLNVDENPRTAESFQVYSIPTMGIMKNGKEVDRLVGCVQKKVIVAALEKHLG